MSLKQIIAATLLLAVSVSAFAGEGVAGVVKTVSGTVYVERENTRLPVTVGFSVLSKDRVVTTANGRAGITLSDDTLLSVGSNSSITLQQFKFNATTNQGNVVLDVLQGSLRAVTGLIARFSPDDFKVTTPSSTIGVRGTDFIVEVLPNDQKS